MTLEAADTLDEAPVTEETPVEETASPNSEVAPPTEDTEAEGLSDEAATTEEYVLNEDEPVATKEAWASIPPAVAKQIRGAVTRKFQRIADEARVVDSLRTKPAETIKMLAAAHGLQVIEPTPKPETPAEDASFKQLENLFGPEIAKQIYPTLQNLSKAQIDERLKPIQEEMERSRTETIANAAQAEHEAFVHVHPDAAPGSPIEKKMMDLGTRIVPARDSNMTVTEYFQLLYALATSDRKASADMAKVVDRVNQSAKAATPPSRTAPPNKVAVRPDKLPTFKEAARAARAGTRYDFEE